MDPVTYVERLGFPVAFLLFIILGSVRMARWFLPRLEQWVNKFMDGYTETVDSHKKLTDKSIEIGSKSLDMQQTSLETQKTNAETLARIERVLHDIRADKPQR